MYFFLFNKLWWNFNIILCQRPLAQFRTSLGPPRGAFLIPPTLLAVADLTTKNSKGSRFWALDKYLNPQHMEKKFDIWPYIVVKNKHHQKLPGAHPTWHLAISWRQFSIFVYGTELTFLLELTPFMSHRLCRWELKRFYTVTGRSWTMDLNLNDTGGSWMEFGSRQHE